MKCRSGCGACCIAISISSSIPGMADGKKAGVICVNLGEDFCCTIHDSASYPKVCRELRPGADICGGSRDEALLLLSEMERLTAP